MLIVKLVKLLWRQCPLKYFKVTTQEKSCLKLFTELKEKDQHK